MPEMKRGATEAETVTLNGWGVGTILRGHEEWADGKGSWNTIRLTAVGESSVLARCLIHERTDEGAITEEFICDHGENSWTLRHRDWQPTSTQLAPTPTSGAVVATRETQED